MTGATGFVGRHLCKLLTNRGFSVIGTTRSSVGTALASNCDLRVIPDISDNPDWGPILKDTDYVVHLAARVHVMQDKEQDPMAAYRRVNVDGTEQLLRHAHMRNIKRFVYISSVKVHGDETGESPFSVNDDLTPSDPYGKSKLEAEQIVAKVGEEIGIETVVVRPPLVYGPGVDGNFRKLMQMIDKGYPLPLGNINNRRSLVGVRNLCSLICECLLNPSAAGQKFLVSDNQDIATSDLIRELGKSMSRPVRLVTFPAILLSLGSKVIGKSAELSRLTGSLQVNIDDTMKILGWQPPVALADEISATVAWYLKRGASA